MASPADPQGASAAAADPQGASAGASAAAAADSQSSSSWAPLDPDDADLDAFMVGGFSRPSREEEEWEHKKPWEQDLHSLGVLKVLDYEHIEFLEWRYLERLQDFATRKWPIIQGGPPAETLEVLKDIWMHLELDADCWMEALMLLHQGPVGRAELSKVLFKVLTEYAITSEYRNLSCNVSSLLGTSRRYLDRPPDGHKDLKFWSLQRASVSRYPEFLPSSVPHNAVVVTDDGGVPRAPPGCWQAPPPPPAPTGPPPPPPPQGTSPGPSPAAPGGAGESLEALIRTPRFMGQSGR